MSIRRLTALAAFSAASLLSTAAFAGEAQSDTSGLANELAKLQVHGYLTQAYARADQHQLYGIPTHGTTDYRTAALQFRYAMTGDDTFVLQLAHERAGDSPIAEEDVQLDFAFYQRHFGSNTDVKLGRVQIPFGVYNELRDVGTVLPFYRVPAAFYGEGSFENETLDGIVATHRFAAGSPWSLEASGYYGGWGTTQMSHGLIAEGKVTDAAGGQLWLSTPVDGLRFGAGGFHAEARGGFLADGVTIPQTVLHASVDGTFDRFVVRGETRETKAHGGIKDSARYVQLGYRVHPKVMLYVQGEQEHAVVPSAFVFAPKIDQDVARDVAASVNYIFRPDLVLKLEGHHNRNAGVEDEPVPFGQLPRADYAIVSVSVSF